MRVAYLTAGAGGMYCGSCMRDNTLAAALRRQGRDVLPIPLYTPIRTDEPDVSTERVYYGGVNVFLQQKSALFRWAPRFVDAVLDSPALLRAALRRAGRTSNTQLGEMTLSVLRGEHGAQRRELEKLLDGLAAMQPGLVHLPNAFFVGIACELKRRLGAPVVCTLTGEDIFLDRLDEGHRDESTALIRKAAADVDGFVAVSRHYANHAQTQFGIPAERIAIVPPGIVVDGDTTTARASATPTIGYLARICPEKGLHELCRAFELLRAAGHTCRLRVAGYLGPDDRAYFDGVRARLRAAGLEGDVDFVGEVDRAGKLAFLRSLDVFSVPTVYREAKGIYVLEAMARGVPVVQPRHGAFPEWIASTGGGVLCEPGDAESLAAAIGRLLDDPAERARLAAAGRAGVLANFTDAHMARAVWAAFERWVGRES